MIAALRQNAALQSVTNAPVPDAQADAAKAGSAGIIIPPPVMRFRTSFLWGPSAGLTGT